MGLFRTFRRPITVSYRAMVSGGASMEPVPPPSLKSRLLRVGLALVAAAFVVVAGIDIAKKWDSTSVQVSFPWLLAAFVPAFLATLSQGFAWRILVAHWIGRPLPFSRSLSLFFAAQLARYTPGKVGLPAMRMAGAPALGVPKSVMASTLLVETFVWGALGCTVSSGLLALFPGRLLALPDFVSKLAGLGVGFGILGLALASLLPREKLPKALLCRIGVAEGHGPLVPLSTIFFVLLHWLLWILHGALIARALGANDESSLVVVGGSLVLGIVVGFFSVLAPAGAGVREAIMGSLATPILGAGGAIIAALAARGASLSAETLLWALFRSRNRANDP